MAAMSNYLENKLVDFIFRGQTFSAPSSLWCALFVSTPESPNPAVAITAVAAEETGAITVFAAEGGKTKVTSAAAHGLANGDLVKISGTTSYNGVFIISSVLTNSFVIEKVFVADDATGTWVGSNVVVSAASHGLVAGSDITISGTTSYNGNFTVSSAVADVSFVIPAFFVADEAGSLVRIIGDANIGTEVSSSGTGYARVEIAPSLTAFTSTQSPDGSDDTVSTGVSGQTKNQASIVFPAPTGDWGRVTRLGIYDAQTSGNLLLHGALDYPKSINNHDSAPSFAAGALVFTLA
jgi:hypothetical protein